MLKMGSVLLVLFNFSYAKFCYFSSLGIARCTVPIRGFKMERVYLRLCLNLYNERVNDSIYKGISEK